MNRITNTWPYVVGVVILAMGWLLIARFTAASTDFGGLSGLWVGTVVPLSVAAGGVILALRRGYDWVVVAVSAVVWLLAALLGRAALVPPPGWDLLAAAAVGYLIIGHVGVVAVLAFKKLNGSGPSDPA